MFVDLDWPLNASSLLSASAELLVFVTTSTLKKIHPDNNVNVKANALIARSFAPLITTMHEPRIQSSHQSATGTMPTITWSIWQDGCKTTLSSFITSSVAECLIDNQFVCFFFVGGGEWARGLEGQWVRVWGSGVREEIHLSYRIFMSNRKRGTTRKQRT